MTRRRDLLAALTASIVLPGCQSGRDTTTVTDTPETGTTTTDMTDAGSTGPRTFQYDFARTGRAVGQVGPDRPVTAQWRYGTGGAIWSSPTVVDGTLYIGSHDHSVSALAADTGEQRWTHETGGEVITAPAVVGGTVYAGSRDDALREQLPPERLLATSDIELVEAGIASPTAITTRLPSRSVSPELPTADVLGRNRRIPSVPKTSPIRNTQ